MTEKKYKSAEQRIISSLEITGPERNFIESFSKCYYGTVASLFRIPTFIRKCNNGQTIIQREEGKIDRKGPKYHGSYGGGILGVISDIAIAGYILSQAYKGNYAPAVVLSATNATSFIFELIRGPKSHHENLEIKAQNSETAVKAV